jgi:arabinofuranosyltransferase
VQKLFGIAPDVASNWLGLGLGLLTLAVIVAVQFRCVLSQRWGRWRIPAAAVTLLGFISNRTYLTWHSSGLETPLFDALLTAWLALLIWPERIEHELQRKLAVCSVGALLALTRPDGMTFALTSAAWVTLGAVRGRAPRLLLALAPFSLVALHVAWRLGFYGQLWPNTYYAKYTRAWPESGLRYLGSFCIEYGLYLPLAVVAWLGVSRLRAPPTRLGAWPSLNGCARWLSRPHVVAWGTVAAHLGSLTLVIGGDHFEFRPYAYVVPWIWLGCLLLAERAFPRPALGFAFLATSWLLSLPIPWLHFQHTRHLYAREQTHFLHVRVAPRLPPPLRAVASVWDDWQGWLIGHYVGMRHQEHKAFLLHQLEFWAPRETGSKLAWQERNVMFATAVGVPGWVFPDVAIIDLLGLNDHVVAHNRQNESAFQRMAHDRWPPSGYVRCFRPNVEGFRKTFRVVPRPLSDDEIRECEARFRRAR